MGCMSSIFLSEFSVENTQVGNGPETVGQDHGDGKDPFWWGRSCMNLMCLKTKKIINPENEELDQGDKHKQEVTKHEPEWQIQMSMR
jgi:hypothetical protein